MNQLQAVAMNEGYRWKKKLFSEKGRALLEKLSLAPWASRRRKELLELLDQLDPKIAELTAAVGQEARKRPEVQLLTGIRFNPQDADLIRHVRLANGSEPYGSAQALLGGIFLILRRTLELSIEQQTLLGFFVFSTWFVARLPVAPYVAFIGPPGSGKTTALRILNLICRRSLLTADISSAAFYELCDRMTTTLLIDETATVDNRRKLYHLLRTGTSQDFVAVRKGNTYKSYGARVVSWIGLPDDAALNSRCVLIPMKSSKRTDLLTANDPQILHDAGKLQRQLLQFRLTNYKTLTLPKISGEEDLPLRTRDIFRALAFPLAESKKTCETLLLLLKQQESLREALSV